jgi:hypothetical protein
MKRYLLIFLLSFLTCNVFAAAVNDDCAGALLLTPRTIGTAQADLYQDLGNSSNAAATICGNTYYLDLWYYFVATNDTMILFQHSLTNGTLPQIELMSGSCGSLVSMGCTNGGAIIYTTLIPGNTYYIRAFDFITQIKYEIALLEKPANDNCQSAFPLAVYRHDQPYAGQLEFWNYESTPGGSPCAGTGSYDNDVWFKFTATDTVHNIFFDGLSSYYYFQYYDGSCSGLTSKGCGSFLNTDHALLHNLNIGQQYYFRLYSQVVNSSAYKFRITLTTLPPNNFCSGALTLPVNTSFTETQSMSDDLWFADATPGSCAANLNDVWYKFTANATDAFIKTSTGADARISVYSGGCAALNAIVCADSSNLKVTGLTQGSTYYIQLGSTLGRQQYYSIAVVPAPGNDDCSGAVVLQPDDESFNPHAVESTTWSATQSMPGCSGNADDDVWFKFTAGKQNYKLNLTTGNFGLVGLGFIYELFSGSCGSLTSLKCDTVKDNISDAIQNLVIGQQYYIRVYTGLNMRTHFRIGLVNSYDECEGARQIELSYSLNNDKLEAYSTALATLSMPSCTGSGTSDIWFKFTATQSGHSYIISDVFPSQAFPSVQLFSGSCGSLSSMQCRSGAAGHFGNLIAGQQYYVRVSTTTTTAMLRFYFRIFAAPSNDEISGALQVPVTNTSVTGILNQATSGATASLSSSCAASGAGNFEDVWYYFVPTQTAQYITSTSFNVQANHFVLEAYDQYSTTSAIQNHQIACGQLTTAIPATGTVNAGDTVWFRVYADTGATGVYSGAFDLSVAVNNPATYNDEAADALELPFSNKYQYIYSTSGFSLSSVNNSCITTIPTGYDLWFKFTATSYHSSIVADNVTSSEMHLELFSGQPGNLTSFGCSDNIYNLPSSLTPGQQYYLRAYHKQYSNSTRIGYFLNDTLEKNNLVGINCLGANLVPNPSMDCATCDTECSAIILVTGAKPAGFSEVSDWFMATDGSTDYFNSCAKTSSAPNAPAYLFSSGGYPALWNDIVPRNGKGYSGFYAYYTGDYREYPEVKLMQTLLPGTTYLVSFNVARSVASSFASNHVGALLTCDKVQLAGSSNNLSYYVIPLKPQVQWNDSNFISRTSTWTNVSAIITADKPYRYLTIGNFNKDINTLVSNPGAWDMTALLYPYTSYLLVDDVVVAEVPSVLDDSCKAAVVAIAASDKKDNAFTIYPNPSSSIIHWREIKGRHQVSIYNVNGSMIYNAATSANDLDISTLLPGIYLIRIESGKDIYTAKFIRKE